MPDLESIQERAVLDTSPFLASLSQESRFLLLDLLTSYTDLWRWNKPDDADTDTIEALVAAASLELMVEAPGGSGDMEFIARLQGADAISFDLINIDTVYRHFRILWSARTEVNANLDSFFMRFNFDDGNNYRWSNKRYLPNSNALAGGVTMTASAAHVQSACAGNTSSANIHNAGYLDIINAQNRGGGEVSIIGANFDNRDGGTSVYAMRNMQAQWLNFADDITDIEIASASASEFTDETFFDVYGVK